MGTTTKNLGLYKPSVDEKGWGSLVDTSFDIIDANLSSVMAAQSLAKGDPGKSLNFRGQWALNVDYYMNDVVRFSNASYVCTIAHNYNNAPTGDGLNQWSLLSQDGASGSGSFATLAQQIGSSIAYMTSTLGITKPNLVNPAASFPAVINTSDGSVNTSFGTSYTAVPFLCAGLAQVSVNQAGTGGPQFVTMAFYDPSGAYISGVPAPGNGANGTYTVPAEATKGIFWNNSNPGVNTLMIVPGAVVPSTYVPYVAVLPESTNIARENAAILTAISSLTPVGSNLFDKTRASLNSLNQVNGGPIAYNGFYTAVIDVAQGAQYTVAQGCGQGNPAYGDVWLDKSGAQIGIAALLPIVDNLTYTAPVGACKLMFTREMAAQGNHNIGAQAVCLGTSAPFSTFPALPLLLPPPSESSVAFTKGKKLGIFGDSITHLYGELTYAINGPQGPGWIPQILARTGMSLVFQDAMAGRTSSGTFTNYSNSSTGKLTSTVSVGVTTYNTQGGPSPLNVGGTIGNTLAQDLAALAVDVMLIFMGTNDQGLALGTPSDALSANTMYGNMTWMVQGIQAARPEMMVIVVAPYQNGFGSLSAITSVFTSLTYAASTIAAPVCDLLHNSGISYISEGNTITATGTIAVGSNQITGLSSTAGIIQGASVTTGNGIPNGTTVTSIGSGSVTISNNATANATGPCSFSGTGTKTFTLDGIHPATSGAERIAGCIVGAMKSYL